MDSSDLSCQSNKKAVMSIKFLLVYNRQGKTRIERWFENITLQEQNNLKQEVHHLTSQRDLSNFSNFVEFKDDVIVYRRYAGLYFVLCGKFNNLLALEIIHFFVDLLNGYFGTVCELDIVYHFYKVYNIVDEVFLAGEIQEISKKTVLMRMECNKI